jgi:competence protein ComEC
MTSVLVGFLDVGQGDCTLVADANNQQVLVIDCPAGRSKEAVSALRRVGASRISVAFVSHSDWDHLGGIYEVVNSVGVDEVRVNLDSIVADDPKEKIKFKAAQRSIAGLADIGVDVSPCYWRDTGTLGDITWRALSPTHDILLLAQGHSDRNIASLILRLEVGSVSLLVGGDAPAGAFERARDRGEMLTSDIFRLPHHGGSIDSLGGPTIDVLLDYVSARHHVVSVGANNNYGHPFLETLVALKARSGRARVTCTEVNKICLGGADFPISQTDSLPELSKLGIGSRNGSCRCAGSVWIRIDDNSWTVEPSEHDHRRVIDALNNPMCRLAI